MEACALANEDIAALFMLVSGVPLVGVGDMVDDNDAVDDTEMVEGKLVLENGAVVIGGEGVGLPVSDAIGTEDVGEKVAAETPLSSFNGT